MSEDKKNMKAKAISCGCGCLIFVALLAASFVAGAKYGKELLDKGTERFNRIYYGVSNEVQGSGSDVEETFQKANEDTKAVYEDINSNEYSN